MGKSIKSKFMNAAKRVFGFFRKFASRIEKLRGRDATETAMIPRRQKVLTMVNLTFIIVFAFSIVLNQILLAKIEKQIGIRWKVVKNVERLVSFSKNSESGGLDVKLTGDISADAAAIILSRGIPEIYGQELGISFDEVQAAMNVMLKYDPTYGKEKIALTGDALQKYINVGLKISCEYCCGAKSIIQKDGKAACGCAHSKAMRGLLAYLIQNHGTEYSDDELLRELARWKGRYFPKQMMQKLSGQLSGTQEFTSDTASLVIGMKLPKYSESATSAPLPSEIKDMPGMVGGC